MRIDDLLGRHGKAMGRLLDEAHAFLTNQTEQELLDRVGDVIESLPKVEHLDNRFIQKSSHKSEDHFVTGHGLFFITEQRKLLLDCTAGHYQMPWGYQPSVIMDVLREGMERGIPWDCHSDIPGNPLKALAQRLVGIANGIDTFESPDLDDLLERDDVLNRAIVSTCTGTVACAAAFRMAYVYYREHYLDEGGPVFVTFENNYHGTDTFAQRMRGMWPEMFNPAQIEFVQIQPNAIEEMEEVFTQYGKRIACFCMEPVMMNNEALLIENPVVKRIRELTHHVDAMMVVDEIQSCFFVPELLMFRQFDIMPDAVIVGKGMTAGCHGLSSVIFNKKFDLLAQFDALSTNGNAPLAAMASLANIDQIMKNRDHLRDMDRMFELTLRSIAEEFPALIQQVMGKGLLNGLKFHDREKALAVRQQLLDQGLWVRIHAYKDHHQSLLMKFALLLNAETIRFFANRLRNVLRSM